MGEPYGIAVDALRPIVVPVPFPGELERPVRAEDVFSAAVGRSRWRAFGNAPENRDRRLASTPWRWWSGT